MGIGTLIIFIAIMLVAAVAASVLVYSSASLQQKALTSNTQVAEGIVTGIEPMSLAATDGSLNSDIEKFELIIRLQAGSGPLNLNTTVLMVDTSSNSMTIPYKGSVESSDATSASDTSQFLAYYIQESDDYIANYVSRGDLVKIKFNCFDCTTGDTGGIGENKRVKIRIIPRIGTASTIEFTTPNSITTNRIDLWP